ncbi:MAG: winged helix-turn-helix transcriptional regulator [Anaerolineaceae bacterium]
MSSTRDKILQMLLNHPHCTISELAEAVNINAISVRHHLGSLQADGLLVAEEERHGVGRPRLVYSLSEKGLERFPTRYLRLTNRLIDQLKETMPDAQVNNLFTQMATEMAAEYAPKVKSMNTEQRLELIKDLLTEEGFSIRWEKQGNQYHIHEITCPYYHVGQTHPEVCSIDQTLISTVLAIPAEKIQCVLRGDNRCTYVVPDLPVEEKSS